MVTRINYDNACEALIALFLANNLPWIDDRYCYYFIEHLTSYSYLGIFFYLRCGYEEGFRNSTLGITRCISENGTTENRWPLAKRST